MFALFDEQMRRGARPDAPGAKVEHMGDLVRQVGTDDGWNGIIWSNLDPESAASAIAEQVEHFKALGRDFEWKVYAHDQPRNLPRLLRKAGFVPEPEETLMVAEVHDLPANIELPDGVHLHPVTDGADVDLVTEVHDRAFGTDSSWIGHQLRAQLREAPETVAVVVAMAGDRPVSSARMELHPGTRFASLWGGGTIGEWRGQGIYRATVAYRARIAAEGGYRYMQVDASSQSRPILQRLGFTPLSTTTPYLCTH